MEGRRNNQAMLEPIFFTRVVSQIKRWLHEMKRGQVIRPSLSLYSSPVPLVKKNDGSRDLCVLPSFEFL